MQRSQNPTLTSNDGISIYAGILSNACLSTKLASRHALDRSRNQMTAGYASNSVVNHDLMAKSSSDLGFETAQQRKRLPKFCCRLYSEWRLQDVKSRHLPTGVLNCIREFELWLRSGFPWLAVTAESDDEDELDAVLMWEEFYCCQTVTREPL